MKKRIVPIVSILISVTVFLYLFFIQQEFKKTLHLNLPILAVTEQYNSSINLKKWFAPFVNSEMNSADSVSQTSENLVTGNYRIDIINTSIYSAILKFSDGKKIKEFLFSAIPDTAKGGNTNLSMIYKNSYLKEWLFKGALEKQAIKNFTDFEEYINDTKRIYGFEIKPVKVVDTLFLFSRKTVPLSEKRIATKAIFENLIAYATKNKLEYNGNRIFYSQSGDGNITLFASIGIAKEITISENEEFEIKRMPYDKNLLEATYQGTYGESNKAFEALKNFLNDRNMSSLAIPYQKFISDGYDFADDQIVQMKVYAPIF